MKYQKDNGQLPKIVLASVLKPIHDPRMYGKFALSLYKDWEVHLIGYEGVYPPNAPAGVHFYPWFSFQRMAWARLKSPFIFLKLLRRVRPQSLIIHAVELLPMAVAYCTWNRIPLFYDVQENYAANIKHQQVYPVWVRWPLSFAISAGQRFLRLFVKKHFLAERCYAEEMNFKPAQYIVLENKCASGSAPPYSTQKKAPVRLAYTGTISEIYGIKEGVNFAVALSEYIPLTLHIAGKFADKAIAQWLLEKQAAFPHILFLEGNEKPVAHEKLMALLSISHFALLPYRPNPSTQNCIPTRLYECMAMGLPMLVQQNPLWEHILEEHQAGLCVDFSKPPTAAWAKIWQEQQFYPKGPVQEAFWGEEEKWLREALLEVGAEKP